MMTVDSIKAIYHAVEKIDLIQSCPACGRHHGTVELYVRFAFNDPAGEFYILGRESEKPIICCGKEIPLLASFHDEESADAAMHGYADLCIALERASSPTAKFNVDLVIPFFPLKEVLAQIRNPSV